MYNGIDSSFSYLKSEKGQNKKIEVRVRYGRDENLHIISDYYEHRFGWFWFDRISEHDCVNHG